MSPNQPGWYQSPDDPTDVERWYTGADWSEYTRPAESVPNDANAASVEDALVTIETDELVDEVFDDDSDAEFDSEDTDDDDTDDSDDDDSRSDHDAGRETDVATDVDADASTGDAANGDAGAGADAGSAAATTAAGSRVNAPTPAPASTAPAAASFAAPSMNNPAMNNPAMNNPAMSSPATATPPPVQPPTMQPPNMQPQTMQPAPSNGPPPPPSPGNETFAQAAAFGRSWMARLIALGDASQSGVDRNVAVLTWLPFFGPIVWISYLFTGRNWSRIARGHVIGSINAAISYVLFELVIGGSFAAGQVTVGLGVLTLLFGGALLGLVIWFMSERYGQSIGHWVWLGVLLLLGLLAVVTDANMLVVFAVVMGIFSLVLIVVNVVRARVGMERSFLGFPVIPILSER